MVGSAGNSSCAGPDTGLAQANGGTPCLKVTSVQATGPVLWEGYGVFSGWRERNHDGIDKQDRAGVPAQGV